MSSGHATRECCNSIEWHALVASSRNTAATEYRKTLACTFDTTLHRSSGKLVLQVFTFQDILMRARQRQTLIRTHLRNTGRILFIHIFNRNDNNNNNNNSYNIGNNNTCSWSIIIVMDCSRICSSKQRGISVDGSVGTCGGNFPISLGGLWGIVAIPLKARRFFFSLYRPERGRPAG